MTILHNKQVKNGSKMVKQWLILLDKKQTQCFVLFGGFC